jgi:glycosyltransferase involved in cell wall biosynthesis
MLNALATYLRAFLNPEIRRVYDFALSRNESLERRLAAEPDGVLVIHWVKPRDAPARTLRKVRGPIAVVLHDARFLLGVDHYPKNFGNTDGPPRLTSMEWLTSRFVRALLPVNDITLICPSLWMREVALAAGWSDRAIATIPYPLDANFWARDQLRNPAWQGDAARIGFGYSGQHAASRKGADVFAEALTLLESHLQTTETRIEIVFFGDALVPQELHKQQAELRASSLGQLRDEELRSVISHLDLVVLPSRQENLAQIALEAQACETPIIVADNTGLESALAPGAGWSFKNGSPQSLADVMVVALERRAEWRARGRRARAFAKVSFSPATIARQYIEWFAKKDWA